MTGVQTCALPIFTEMLKDKNGLRNASDQALNAKFIAAVKERATFDNKTVSFEEFNKFFQ